MGSLRPWSPDRGIREKLLALIVVPCVVLILFIVTFAWVAIETQSYTVVTRDSSQALQAYGDLLTTLIDAETGMRGYVVTGASASARPCRPLQRASGDLKPELQRIRALPADTPALLAKRTKMAALAVRVFQVDAHLVVLADRGK